MNCEAETGARIDAALRSVGAAPPPPGLEGRILTRLASGRLQLEAEPARLPGLPRLIRLPRFSAPLLGAASACLVGAVIVAGSVSHSRKLHPHERVAPVVLQMPGQGLGAASAVHPAAPPSSVPVPAGPAARGHSARRSARGRARIAPHAHKAPGIAVPDPNSSPQN